MVIARRWRCLSFCLLTTHYHGLVETPQPDLGAGMRDCLSRFVLKRHERHGGRGPAFDSRFHNSLVDSDAYLVCALRYVALNAFNAGMCTDPREYRWSNHADMLSGREGPLAAVDRVEQLLGVWGGPHGTRYGRLLAPAHKDLGTWSDARSPKPERPTIGQLVISMPLVAALGAARAHGYRVAEIAAVTGLSPSKVSRLTHKSE